MYAVFPKTCMTVQSLSPHMCFCTHCLADTAKFGKVRIQRRVAVLWFSETRNRVFRKGISGTLNFECKLNWISLPTLGDCYFFFVLFQETNWDLIFLYVPCSPGMYNKRNPSLSPSIRSGISIKILVLFCFMRFPHSHTICYPGVQQCTELWSHF